jgi:Ca2+-binding EF-hand superfamily protein
MTGVDAFSCGQRTKRNSEQPLLHADKCQIRQDRATKEDGYHIGHANEPYNCFLLNPCLNTTQVNHHQYIHQRAMGNCASGNKGVEDLDPENAMLVDLACESRFTKQEISALRLRFLELAPSERMLSRDFELFLVEEGQNEFLASVAFQAFDKNGDGEIDFREFVHALSSMTRGTRDEKLDFAFNLYDIDGDGTVTKDELLKIIGGLYQSGGGFSQDQNYLETVEEIVDRVLEEATEEGCLTREEFVRAIADDPTIVTILGLM